MAKQIPIPERVTDFGVEVLQLLQDQEEWSSDTLEDITRAASGHKLIVENTDQFEVLPEVRSAMGITAPVLEDDEEEEPDEEE